MCADVAGQSADQQGAEGEARGVGSERDRRAGDEQERADRRRDQLVDPEERAGHPRVRRGQVLARHDPGQEAALGDVGERLGGAQQEQRAEDERDVHVAGDDRRREEPEDHRSRDVEDDRDRAPVQPVGGGAGPQAEEQRRRDLDEVGHRDEERVARLGGDEERARGEGDPVAEIAEDRGREQPAEALSEPRGSDRFDQRGHGRPDATHGGRR